jgi:hypothetical protein
MSDNSTNARHLLDKLRNMSQKMQKTFDEIPDMKAEGMIDKLNMKDFADESLGKMQEDAEKAGFKLEAKVVGVALRVLMLDPDDPTRTHMVTTEVITTHPKLDLRELLGSTESMHDIDHDQLMHKNCGEDCEPPYEPKSKYDGHMYG